MHTVEQCYNHADPSVPRYEVVFYSGMVILNRDESQPHRIVVATGLDKVKAYQTCNYLNGGRGKRFD